MTDAATRQILTQALITKISSLEAELKRCREHVKRADEYLSRMRDLDDDNATHHIRAIGALVQAKGKQ